MTFNKLSPDWLAARSFIDVRIKEHHARMEALSLTDGARRDLAVRIAELRDLVRGLETPDKPMPTQTTVTY